MASFGKKQSDEIGALKTGLLLFGAICAVLGICVVIYRMLHPVRFEGYDDRTYEEE
ncbi:MAG: hypothetical protein IJV26_11630 [Lachnospiraceae bacterium]|nr:hypothetical protein [Lachnospiraceae bacterium]MBQ9644676.1 hypothetical protein [Lachnospiraceae bacterium]